MIPSDSTSNLWTSKLTKVQNPKSDLGDTTPITTF